MRPPAPYTHAHHLLPTQDLHSVGVQRLYVGVRVVPGVLEQISPRAGRCSASSCWSYSLTWILALPHASSNGLWSPTRGRSLPQYHGISRTDPKKDSPVGGGPESTVSGTRDSQPHPPHRYRPLVPKENKVPSLWGSLAVPLSFVSSGRAGVPTMPPVQFFQQTQWARVGRQGL